MSVVTWGDFAPLAFILEPSVKGQQLPGGGSILGDGSSSIGQFPLNKHISNTWDHQHPIGWSKSHGQAQTEEAGKSIHPLWEEQKYMVWLQSEELRPHLKHRDSANCLETVPVARKQCHIGYGYEWTEISLPASSLLPVSYGLLGKSVHNNPYP